MNWISLDMKSTITLIKIGNPFQINLTCYCFLSDNILLISWHTKLYRFWPWQKQCNLLHFLFKDRNLEHDSTPCSDVRCHDKWYGSWMVVTRDIFSFIISSYKGYNVWNKIHWFYSQEREGDVWSLPMVCKFKFICYGYRKNIINALCFIVKFLRPSEV